jgi:hypothetical protein
VDYEIGSRDLMANIMLSQVIDVLTEELVVV